MLPRHMGIRTMTMIAVALSEEYGVRVVSSGRRAHTYYQPDDGRPIITIPSVDAEDDNYLVLLRGYIDHEVGHVRFTKHKELAAAIDAEGDATGAMKIISHIYEDVYAERLMGECFPGCRRNIRKLVSLIFDEQRPAPINAAQVLAEARSGAKGAQQMPYHIWTAVSQYILYRIRRDATAGLEALLPAYREPVDLLAPGLVECLEPVLSRVAAEGTGTPANVALAKETLRVINEFFNNDWEWYVQEPEYDGAPGRSEDRLQGREAIMDQLQWVLRFGGNTSDSVDISRSASNIVDTIMKEQETKVQSYGATIPRGYRSEHWHERLSLLSYAEQKESLQASTLLDAQMQSLLQTLILNRSGSARTGKLNTYMLHRLSTGNSNIFRKNVEKQGINTEIVIAADMSGSMADNDKSVMASKALYAVVCSLRKLPGVKSSVIGFYDDSVLDILRHNDMLTPQMKISPDGGTLCGEALTYAMQVLTNSQVARKIVLMLTDGDTGNPRYFEKTIVAAKRAGIEFLGIGIMDPDITYYLQEKDCCVIDDMQQLAPEMFRMLWSKLFAGKPEASALIRRLSAKKAARNGPSAAQA